MANYNYGMDFDNDLNELRNMGRSSEAPASLKSLEDNIDPDKVFDTSKYDTEDEEVSGIDYDEIWVPRMQIVSMCGFSLNEFNSFVLKHAIKSRQINDRRVSFPILKIIRCLVKDRKNRKAAIGDEEVDIDAAKKWEEVMKLRIINQERMGVLIPREYAKKRSIGLLTAFAQKMRYTIKNVSAKLMGAMDARVIERILTEDYNRVIDSIEKEAEIVSWEVDGAKDELGRTELLEAAGEVVSSRSSSEDTATSQE